MADLSDFTGDAEFANQMSRLISEEARQMLSGKSKSWRKRFTRVIEGLDKEESEVMRIFGKLAQVGLFRVEAEELHGS